jgi:hypothetical protein
VGSTRRGKQSSLDELGLPKKWGGLGYKDLHSFNMAMLAKQGWRLLTDPTSLCARVLKAKYFPNSDVLHARPKEGMSYTWRSILKGIELLKEGLIKRVGNGLSIDIWKDPWVMREGSPFLITRKENRVLSKVREFINLVEGCWDEELIDDCIWPADAPCKKNSNKCRGGGHVGLAPGSERQLFCEFSLQAASYLIGEGGASSDGKKDSGGDQFEWKDIWSCHCPPNVQQFMWRLAHDSVPHRCNIERRGIEIDTL